MNQNTKRRWLAALLGAAAGMVVFFLLYGTSTLHPTYDAWILNGYDEWDIQQHYAGWVLFRNSHWAFPLGLADTIAAPDGTVISFTDSIPWVSIFFKALRGVMPSTFQWFGWYTLFCFAMQGAAVRSVRPRAGKNWRGERWCFPHWAVCCLLCCLPCGSARSAIPRWPASGCFCWRCMPFWNTVKTCTAARPNSPGPCRCWPFWRWASTRTFCRWS